VSGGQAPTPRYYFRKRTDPEPASETGAGLTRPLELDRPATYGLSKRELTEVDPRQGGQLGTHGQVERKAGIAETEFDVGALEHKPEGLLLSKPEGPRPCVVEVEACHDAPVRKLVDIDTVPEEPHQKPRVEVLGPKLVRRPFVAPRAERDDDRSQLFPCRRQ
jgi:hypothetical protein